MPRPESIEMTTPKLAKPKAITIAQLAAEYLPTIKPPLGPKSFYSHARTVLNVLMSMPEVRDTADLALNEAFVERWLNAWSGSTVHDSIVGKLSHLEKLRDWTLKQGYYWPSKIGEAVPVPPAWDERDERFAQSDRVLKYHQTRRSDPDPTWEEVAQLVTHLKTQSRRWLDARLLALVSLVTLARLQPYSEAAPLRRENVDWEGQPRILRIPGRAQIKLRRSMACIPLGGHLAEILDRWSRRSGSVHVIPNQGLSSYWNISDTSFGVGSGNAQLAEACKAAGIRNLMLRGLKRFGEKYRERLESEDSPFRLEPGDGLLRAEDITIARLRQEVIALYGPTPKSTLRRMLGRINSVFDAIEALPGNATSFDLATHDFIERFASSLEISDPYRQPHDYVIGYIHIIINKSLFLGYTESSPFVGVPGFFVQMNGRPRLRRERSEGLPLDTANTTAAVEQPGESSPWDDWDASVCPVHVREDGHMVVFGRVKRRLISKVKIDLVSALAERYPNGGFGLKGLKDRFGRGGRQAFYSLKKIDADCRAAFQPAIVKNRDLYRIGRKGS
jgi:integrase